MPENLDIPSKNTAFVLHGVKDTRYEDRPTPEEVGEHDCIVAPKKTGLCGSDTHYLLHGKIGDFVVKDPMILGHESAGVVVKVGSSVKGLKKGDRVALEPGESCRMCPSCKEGKYNRCPEMIFAATPPYDGTLQSFYKLPADLCYKLPDSVSLEEGALIEPMAVAVMAVHTVGQMPHAASVAVFGAGPVGLLTMAVAKALGASFVLAVDIQEPRLKFAKEYAATEYFVSSKKKDGEEQMDYARRQSEEIRTAFKLSERGPGGVDLVIDCSGAEVCIQTGLFLAKHGGTHVQVGMGKENITIPMSTVLNKELSVKGSFRYGPGCYPLAISLVASKKVQLGPLITHRYSFKEADAAFQANQDGKGADGKPLIKAMIDGPE